MINMTELKIFLEEKYRQYNSPEFIEKDPVYIPHIFSRKEDIEIAGFLAAIIAWGQRKTIIANALWLMERMDFTPYEFVLNENDSDLQAFSTFVHRTFNGVDCVYFLKALQHI